MKKKYNYVMKVFPHLKFFLINFYSLFSEITYQAVTSVVEKQIRKMLARILIRI